MSKIILIASILLWSLCSYGQVYITEPISGKPYAAKLYEDIKGTAWLYEDWKTGNVTDKYGTTYPNIEVKFDLYENKLFYNHNNSVYEFVTDIREIRIYRLLPGDTTNMLILKRGFALNDVVTTSKYVQVLAEGKVTFLKYIYKSLDESTEYNVPGKIKTFSNRSTYFYLKEGKSQSLKPSPKLLEELTKDKWGEVEAYMKQSSLSAKNEDDFARLIKYYNSL